MWFCFASLLPALPRLRFGVKHLVVWVLMFLQGCGARGCARRCRGVCGRGRGHTWDLRGAQQRPGQGGLVPSLLCQLEGGSGRWLGTSVALLGCTIRGTGAFQFSFSSVPGHILGIPGETTQAVPQADDFCLSLCHSPLCVCADFICLRKSLFPHPKPALQSP